MDKEHPLFSILAEIAPKDGEEVMCHSCGKEPAAPADEDDFLKVRGNPVCAGCFADHSDYMADLAKDLAEEREDSAE